MPRSPSPLTPEQRDEADRIKQRLMAVVEDEIQGIAELLASKPDRQILGETEFQVRDPGSPDRSPGPRSRSR